MKVVQRRSNQPRGSAALPRCTGHGPHPTCAQQHCGVRDGCRGGPGPALVLLLQVGPAAVAPALRCRPERGGGHGQRGQLLHLLLLPCHIHGNLWVRACARRAAGGRRCRRARLLNGCFLPPACARSFQVALQFFAMLLIFMLFSRTYPFRAGLFQVFAKEFWLLVIVPVYLLVTGIQGGVRVVRGAWCGHVSAMLTGMLVTCSGC